MALYTQPLQELLNYFKTNVLSGLDDAQVQSARTRYGYNVLPSASTHSITTTFINQFLNPLIYILIAASAIIYLVGDHQYDAFIIAGVLIFNAVLGTIQEERTARMLDDLQDRMVNQVLVVRTSVVQPVNETELVPGDIMMVSEGQRVPADARIIESFSIKVDESLLTGESHAIAKSANDDQGAMSLLFKGTYVVAGNGKAVVIATGVHTKMGAIYHATKTIITDIPLKQSLEKLSYTILWTIVGLCVLLFGVGYAVGMSLNELSVVLTALFICVVPEGLPVVLMVILVTGAYRMAKHAVVVKNMQAVEALSRVRVLILDKTGTITRNEMMVSKVVIDDTVYTVTGSGYAPEGTITPAAVLLSSSQDIHDMSHKNLLAVACGLLSNSTLTYNKKTNSYDLYGDPTEAALSVLAHKIDPYLETHMQEYQKIYELPFDQLYKYHVGVYKYGTKYIAFISGAPELLVGQLAADVQTAMNTHIIPLLDAGLRVAVVGYASIDDRDWRVCERSEMRSYIHEHILSQLTILGICAMHDAIKDDAAVTINTLKKAGLRVIMATGDHAITARQVAHEVGIGTTQDRVVEGVEFDTLSDDQLEHLFGTVSVYARLTPAHKMRLITVAHAMQQLVAMTGDGMNDAPALSAADVGIAVGSKSTQLAREAADILVLNNSLHALIVALEQGRHVFYTLKRIVLYFFATNLAEVIIVVGAFIYNIIYANSPIPLPLAAAHILWLNLITDGLLDVALSLEPQEDDLLSPTWIEYNQHLIDYPFILKTLYFALPMGLCSLMMFILYYHTTHDIVYARTVALITMVTYQWFNAWNCRSFTISLCSWQRRTNIWLWLAAFTVLALQWSILTIPWMNLLFGTVPLRYADIGIIMFVAFPVVIIEELRKMVVRSRALRT